MGHTNSTVNYNLPQFVGTDKPSWLGDVNGAFLAIDTAIAAAKTTADSAAGGVAGLQTTVGSHTTQISTLTDTVTAQGGTLNTVTALIGNGEPTTTDKTLIGAINELNSEIQRPSIVGSAVDIKSYTSTDNLYECQSDGYVQIIGSASGDAGTVRIYGSSDVTNYAVVAATDTDRVATYVNKGMRLMYMNTAQSGNPSAVFRPLT